MIVSDTFGRTWRRGVTDVAIGCAGIAGVVDLRGTPDALGREMQVTEVAVVDEIAAAAELVMGKSTGIPVAVVRGVDPDWLRDGSVHDEIVRRPARTCSAMPSFGTGDAGSRRGGARRACDSAVADHLSPRARHPRRRGHRHR